MKKLNPLFFLGLILFLLSCQETVQYGDKLTPAEREALRLRAAAQCISESNNSYEKFQITSNVNMLRFYRNQTWKIEFKKDTQVQDKTFFISVWKKTATDVYFILSTVDGGTTTNKYFKIDTTANINMIRSIQAQGCASDKTVVVSGNDNSKTVTVDPVAAPNTQGTWFDSRTDYKFSSAYPAFYGSLINTLVKKTLSGSGGTVTETDTYDYSISTQVDATLPADYASVDNPDYCVIKYTPAVAPAYNSYVFPYDLNCDDALDADGDGNADFVPAAELINPI